MRLACGVVLSAVLALPCAAQPAEFQIVWVVIGEAASADETHAARAGRQLFMASDLLALSLENIRVVHVDVEPAVLEIGIGEELCLTSLQIRAYDSDRQAIAGAPLSVSIRQDHRRHLRPRRSRRNICLRPDVAGEYSVRMTSLLPAPDGTMRGAQVFVRVADRAAPGVSGDMP